MVTIFQISDKLTYSDAKEFCKELNATLVTFANEEENSKARQIQYNGNFWIGLERHNGVWKWVDNLPLGYNNWLDNRTEHLLHEGLDCVQDKYYQVWDNVQCTEKAYFICQYEQFSKTSQFWLGLEKVSGMWRWNDGSPIVYEKFQASCCSENANSAFMSTSDSWIEITSKLTPASVICKYKNFKLFLALIFGGIIVAVSSTILIYIMKVKPALPKIAGANKRNSGVSVNPVTATEEN
uniref:C-type lectin domain-containing protein n=1 Tax=Syphacia muris TaxID=451379 RepID=A0A0N5ALD8_9BILA